jgi:hypothetical protein
MMCWEQSWTRNPNDNFFDFAATRTRSLGYTKMSLPEHTERRKVGEDADKLLLGLHLVTQTISTFDVYVSGW